MTEVFERDLEAEAENVYRTSDSEHPGVAAIYEEGARCIAGTYEVDELPDHEEAFTQRQLSPAESKQAFADRGWKRIVAFQTRNPIHRAHEHVTKTALEITDGLMIHPLIGKTKAGDIPAEVRMRCYEVLMDRLLPRRPRDPQRLPLEDALRGPARGRSSTRSRAGTTAATHFIVGRDHAGVGDYYGTYDAQEIFDELEIEQLGIQPLFFEHTFWCNSCEGMASGKTCPHGQDDHVFLSGTKVREMLGNGEKPPQEFSRPEVAQILIDEYSKGGRQSEWLTRRASHSGSPGSRAPARRRSPSWSRASFAIAARGLEMLDGDVVRENLSKGLGFSKEDRDTNIRRIAFVADLLSRNGVPVITAAISPYREIRDEARGVMGDRFIEIFVKASVEVCAERDVKGLYEKAFEGEIKEFTGVSDPYEEPLDPELTLDTENQSPEESAGKILTLLEERQLIPAAQPA